MFSRRVELGEDGATALEFALIAPALILLLFVTIDTARLLHVMAALDQATARAARANAIAGGSLDDSQLATLVADGMQRLAAPRLIPATAVRVEHAGCGARLDVAISYTPMLLPQNLAIPLSASACGRASA